jgi:zonular occludens toxin Zot
MIQLIEAPPRSGKSYFAVNYLCKFTKYDALYNEYILDGSVLIISNIEGLRINHWQLDECLKTRSMEEFFSIANFERIMEKTGKTRVILCIDECHRLFPAGFTDNNIYDFFAYHGHIGLDVILMCQSLDRTSRMFNPLLEFIVKVTPRSRAVLNRFSYEFVDLKGRFLYSRTLPKLPLVFRAYKSFRQDEHQKPKNAVKHWIVITVVFLVCAVFLFKSALAIVKGKSETADKHVRIANQRLQSPVAPSSPSPPVVAGSTLPSVPSPSPVPAYHNLTTATGPAAPGQNTAFVVGLLQSGNGIRYLLNDGRIIGSRRTLIVGDAFSPGR